MRSGSLRRRMEIAESLWRALVRYLIEPLEARVLLAGGIASDDLRLLALNSVVYGNFSPNSGYEDEYRFHAVAGKTYAFSVDSTGGDVLLDLPNGLDGPREYYNIEENPDAVWIAYDTG